MPEPLLALELLLALPQTMPTGKKYSGFRKGIFTSSQPLAVIDSGLALKPSIYMVLKPWSSFSATRVLFQASEPTLSQVGVLPSYLLPILWRQVGIPY